MAAAVLLQHFTPVVLAVDPDGVAVLVVVHDAQRDVARAAAQVVADKRYEGSVRWEVAEAAGVGL
jgi:hypothetical protein